MLDEVLLYGVGNRGSSAGDAEFCIDMGQVVFNRFFTDTQRACDLRGVLPLSEEAHHLYFALGQISRL